MSFDDFIATQFHDGATLSVKKHAFTKNNLLVIYNAETTIQAGTKYQSKYSDKMTLAYNIIKARIADMEIDDIDNDNGDGLYYETPFGSLSISEAFPFHFPNDDLWDANFLPQTYKTLRSKIKNETDGN